MKKGSQLRTEGCKVCLGEYNCMREIRIGGKRKTMSWSVVVMCDRKRSHECPRREARLTNSNIPLSDNTIYSTAGMSHLSISSIAAVYSILQHFPSDRRNAHFTYVLFVFRSGEDFC